MLNEEIKKLYCDEKLSIKKIAEIVDLHHMKIYRILKRSGISLRPRGCQNQYGINNPNWKGGVAIGPKGYIIVRNMKHPNAHQDGYLYRSRVVAEKALDRHLKNNEIVHHINGNHTDDRNENLLVCSRSYHQWLHKKMESRGINQTSLGIT